MHTYLLPLSYKNIRIQFKETISIEFKNKNIHAINKFLASKKFKDIV